MATLKSIRKRIASVRNTQKITKAMKMVSAAKLRRAQNRLIQARPYAERVEGLLRSVATLAGSHPFFETREPATKAEFLILTSDRGLCGGFNGNLLRRIENFLQESGTTTPEVRVRLIGKKGRDFFKAHHREPLAVETGIYEKFTFAQAAEKTEAILHDYREGRFDHFYLVYNRFKSAISQEIRIDRILPIEPQKSDHYLPEYLYEPDRDLLIDSLVKKGLAALLYRAVLESTAAEFGARMAAMESATNNCTDMIYRLTLQLNRARQAAITRELMDIVNGAEALK